MNSVRNFLLWAGVAIGLFAPGSFFAMEAKVLAESRSHLDEFVTSRGAYGQKDAYEAVLNAPEAYDSVFESVALFNKGNKRIIWIGTQRHDIIIRNPPFKKELEEQELLKHIIFPFLERMSYGQERSVFLLWPTRPLPSQGALRSTRDEIALYQGGRPTTCSGFVKALQAIAELSKDDSNLSFEYGDAGFAKPMAGLPFYEGGIWDADTTTTLKPFFERWRGDPKKLPGPFFEKGGPYDLLVKSCRYWSSVVTSLNSVEGLLPHSRINYTLADTLKLFESMRTRMLSLCDSSQISGIRARAENLAKQLLLKREELPGRFSKLFHPGEWSEKTQVDYALELFKSTKDYIVFTEQFYDDFIFPYLHVNLLLRQNAILDAAERYNTVIVVEPLCRDTVDMLAQCGYESECHGMINPADECPVEIEVNSRLTVSHVLAFLSSVLPDTLKFDVPLSALSGISRFFGMFTFDDALLKRIKVASQLPGATKCTFRNLSTGDLTSTPAYNHAEFTCLACKGLIRGHTARMLLLENTCLCSTGCSNQYFLALPACADLSRLLTSEDILDKKERFLLRQVAALCYLAYLSLDTKSLSATGEYYSLNHGQLQKSLGDLLKDTHWKQARDCVQALGISLTHLKFLSGFFSQAKDNYLGALLHQAKKRKYKELSREAALEFDADGKVRQLVENLHKGVSKSLKCDATNPTGSFARLYYDLMAKIAERIEFLPEDWMIILSKDYSEKPQKEKPAKAVAKKIRSKKQSHKEFYVPVREEEELEVESAIQPREESAAYSTEEIIAGSVHEPAVTRVVADVPQPRVRSIDIPAQFAGMSYMIRLFNGRAIIPRKAQTGRMLWETCKHTRYAYRLQCIFSLYTLLKNKASAKILPRSGSFCLECDDEEFEEFDNSLRTKIDVHHLFPFHVDAYLHKYGIAELVGEGVQLSLPGVIIYEDGSQEVGFFQESFLVRDESVCIHRCFKGFRAQESKYISQSLRKTFDYIQEANNTH